MQSDQRRSAKEQGNDREQDSHANIAPPMRIRSKAEIGQAPHIADAQKRPKQQNGSNQNGAVKEPIEIVLRQRRKHAVRCERLSGPEKNRSKKRPHGDDRDKIGC